MARCSFCGRDIMPGKGKLFVFRTGKTMFFCSNKCEKNSLKLKRTARNLKWTKYYEKGKRSLR